MRNKNSIVQHMAHACDVTTLLHLISKGDTKAVNTLWEQLQGELREMAIRLLNRESDVVTIQPTQLINESFIRLQGMDKSTIWEHRGHFFGSVARAMGQVLIDRARSRGASKRGGGLRPISLDTIQEPVYDIETIEIEPLIQAMRKLDEESPRVSDVVWLKIVGSMTLDQISAALDISRRTAASDWQYALAWLRDELSANGCC